MSNFGDLFEARAEKEEDEIGLPQNGVKITATDIDEFTVTLGIR
jgi:hypothetical protein